VYAKYSDANTGAAVQAWAEYIAGACQKQAKSVDYAPLPKEWSKNTLTRLQSGIA
jgi:hypothetical protein